MNFLKRNLIEKIYLYLHLKIFNHRKKNQFKFKDKFILSIGNLSAGGTGKTPVALLIAKYAIQKKIKTGIVLRGYKGKMSTKGMLVSDGNTILANHRQAGDEALLFGQVKGLKVAICKNRRFAIQRYLADCDFIILDDAFQNPSIYHDHDLVLIDSTIRENDFKLIPAGRFREPESALIRANSVLLTRSDMSNPGKIAFWKKIILQMVSKSKLYESQHIIEKIHPGIPVSAQIGIISGIGNPEAFQKTVEQSVGKISKKIIYPDHYLPSRNEFLSNFKDNEIHWITTSKDLVRFAGYVEKQPAFRKRLHCLEIKIKIKGSQKKFLDCVVP